MSAASEPFRFDGPPFMNVGRARSSDVGGEGHRGRRAMGRRPPRVTATAAKSTKRSREEDEGAELANVEGGTLTGHWPRRVKPPAERTSPRKKGFLSSPVHVDVQRLRCVPRAYAEQAPQLVPIVRLGQRRRSPGRTRFHPRGGSAIRQPQT